MKRIVIVLQLLLAFLFLCPAYGVAKNVLHYKFIGVQGELLKNIQARLDIVKAGKEQSVDAIKQLFNEGPEQIVKAIQPYGYFRARVSSNLAHKRDGWYATYRVHLGKPLRITGLDIRISGPGQSESAYRRLLETFPLKRGDVFVASQYTDAKNSFFVIAEHLGYLRAQLDKSQVQINLQKYSCNIVLHFVTGLRFYFGPVTFSDTPFAETFLQRFVPFKVGDYYSDKGVQTLQEGLGGSNLFQNVVITPNPNRAQNLHVPIHVHLKLRKAKHYTIGAGYGTDTGIRGILGVDLRYINPTGHQFSGIVHASQKEGNLTASYLIPGRNPVTDQYVISAAGEIDKQPKGINRTVVLSAGYNTVVYGWKQAIKLNLQQEWSKLYGQPVQSSMLLIPSIDWIRSKGNDPLRPTRGYKLEALIKGALHGVVANISFLQFNLTAKILYPLWNDHTIIVARGAFGYTAVSKSYKLPLSLRFNAGGALSIRGYGYQELGPGNNLLVGSLELRQKVFGNWYAAVFYDAGDAANQLLHRLHQGAGVGIVWLSPIGAIQLSYAKAIDKSPMPGMIQFSMGPEL